MSLDNNDSPSIDLFYLHEYTDGDEGAMSELIEVFLETASEGIEDFRSAVSNADAAPWKAAAHKLKGASGYVGALRLKELCAEAELCENPTSDERAQFLAKIEICYGDVRKFLESKI